jgi:DNA-binding transcriptional ArsR family regulator
MEDLAKALANETRLAILRELRRQAEPKHGELLQHLGMRRADAPTLTKHIGILEEAGLVLRREDRYALVEPQATAELLVRMAVVNVAARRRLAEAAQEQIDDAIALEAELKLEASRPPQGGETGAQVTDR